MSARGPRRYQLQVNVNDTATELHRLHSHARLAVAPDQFHMAKGNHPNHGRVVSVHLIRQFDKSDIPYVTVHGVTLITMLRLGLLSPLVTRAYHQFVALPLYEDMAPWNIVFLGVRCCFAVCDSACVSVLTHSRSHALLRPSWFTTCVTHHHSRPLTTLTTTPKTTLTMTWCPR